VYVDATLDWGGEHLSISISITVTVTVTVIQWDILYIVCCLLLEHGGWLQVYSVKVLSDLDY